MVGKLHRIHIPEVGEGVAHLLGGVPYEVDAEQKFPLGTYVKIGNKGFVYAKASGTLNTDLGVKNQWNQEVGFSAIQANYDAGVKRITLTVTGDIDKDELVGGEVIIFPHGMTNSFSRGIIGNSVLVTSGTLTLDLDSPTPVEITTSGNGEVMKNPYDGVKSVDDAWRTVLGIPTCVAEDGEYLWLQVEGPCFVAPVGAGVGNTAGYKEVTFSSIGTVEDEVAYHQRAGVIIVPNTSGGAEPAPFINLQIAH